jgi:hypothetical protein
MKVTTLSVYPNPYTAIHRWQGPEDGVSWIGTLQLEPDGPAGYHGQIPRYVGCQHDTDKTVLIQPEKYLTVKDSQGRTATSVSSFAQHDVAYKYATGPVKVPNTQYYRDAVFRNDLTGHSALVAADVETARACGINSEQFRDPLALLEELRLEAIKRFAAGNSDITEADLLERLPSVFAAPAAPTTQKSAKPSQAFIGGQS